MCGWSTFIAFQTLCSSWIMAGDGTEWLSNLETCLHKAVTEPYMTGSGEHRGYKPLILAMSWLGKCVEITCDSVQRVSCGRGGHTQLAHTSAPNRHLKSREKPPGWHQRRSELLNRSVFGSRNLQKSLNSTSGGLGRSVYVYTFVKEELFVQCVFPFGNCVWVWEKCIECAIWTPLKRRISMVEFAQVDPAIAK